MILPGNDNNTLPLIEYEEMKGTILIQGRAISVDIVNYFKEFLEYFNDNITKNRIDLKITIDLEYFSTQAAKMFVEFFKLLKEEVLEHGNKATVIWMIEEGDEDMLNAADDFSYIAGFNFIVKEK